MFFIDLCVSRFHSFARIKFCGGETVGFDAVDGSFETGIQSGLVGERSGVVFLVFQGAQFCEGAEQGKDGWAVEPELGVEEF
jgi:hypothetical protein